MLFEKTIVPSDNIGNGWSDFLVENQSENESNVDDQCNISNWDFVSCKIGSLSQLIVNYSQNLQVVFLASLIDFFGQSWVVAQSSIDSSGIQWTDLSIDELEPLVNWGSLSSVVSIELSNLSGEVSEDGSWLKEISFRSFQRWYFAKRMYFQIFRGL